MLTLQPRNTRNVKLLCIGAHADDLEIGCAGTMLELLVRWSSVDVTWVVLSAVGPRGQEARESARRLLRRAQRIEVRTESFRDGYFPAQYSAIKDGFEALKRQVSPDIIFTHARDDLHQDHRLVAELTWNTFRDHLILEYEIPKYDGGLGSPSVFVPVSTVNLRRKVALLMRGFASQRSKRWFAPETFIGLMRIRGIECNSPSGYAEAFHGRKIVIA